MPNFGFRYMEKVMKFINRNAYILVAVKGYTFCGGALRAIKLIVLNVGRLAAVNIIGDALIFLGKLTIVLASGSLAFLMTDMPAFSNVDSANYVSSPIVPVILTMLAAYMVASVFFAVRAQGIMKHLEEELTHALLDMHMWPHSTRL